MTPIVFRPHECKPPTIGHYPRGSVWECERCSSRWTRYSELGWNRLDYKNIDGQEYREPELPDFKIETERT